MDNAARYFAEWGWSERLVVWLNKRLRATDFSIPIVSESEGYFELFHFSKPDVVIAAQYLLPLPVNKHLHGSSNNTEIYTIARFEVPDFEKKSPPNFFVSPIHNTNDTS